MASFNQVVLMGNLARDPELRYTPQGTAVANFTVAVNRRFTKQSGEKVEEVAFVDVTVWQRLAEITAEYLKKGRAVHLVGHFVQDRWEDPESGQKRSKLRVTAQQVVFLGKGSQDDDPAAGDDSPAEEALPPAPAPAPARSSAARSERRVRRA